MTHSLLLDSGDRDQLGLNPWNSRSNDTSSAFHRDMIISPSPPPPPPQPQAAPPVPAQPPMQVTDTPSPDPRIASLKAIFPDFDDAVILSVLESTNDDHDRALDVLLGMNDPSFVPLNPPTSQPPDQFQFAPSSDAQRLSQEALDEQFARRLALEDQEAANQAWQPQGIQGQAVYQPYDPRRGGRNGWGNPPQGQPQTQGQGGRDTVAEFQEGFTRIAESGKKTFSSIVSKVKAKMQEFDQGQGWTSSWSQGQPPNQPPQSAPGPYSSAYAPGPQQGQGAHIQPYQSSPAPNPQRQASLSRPAWTSASPPRSGVSRPAQSESPQQPSYYDPNTRGYDLYDDGDEIQLNDARTTSPTPATSAITASATSQTLGTSPHADNSVSSPPTSDTSSLPSYTSPVLSSPNPTPSSSSPLARSLSSTIAGARSTTPGAPGGVDFSKLGLLPKRPISLVRPQSPPASGAGAGASVGAPRMAPSHSESTTDSSTDREEPEFVENPFEDQ